LKRAVSVASLSLIASMHGAAPKVARYTDDMFKITDLNEHSEPMQPSVRERRQETKVVNTTKSAA
jgi:hypothetical protein